MPKPLDGADETFGIADIGKPGRSKSYEGMDEENLEKPSSDLPKNVISDEKGETTGPKDKY